MNAYKVIASLHHQLAEAYDALAREQDAPPAPRRRLAKASSPSDDRALKLVREGLRKQGIKTP